jgi:predicted Fe-Mo cluster-binding NifX family protein
MRISIPCWQERISPVFDVAGCLMIVDLEHGKPGNRLCVYLEEESVYKRVNRMLNFDVDVLICGAISRPLETALLSEGIEVIPQTCGELEPVIQAYVEGKIDEDSFLMPGCCGYRKRSRSQSYSETIK